MARELKYEDSLEYKNPELAAQWHPTKNGDLKPSDVGLGSHESVWWKYSYDVPDDYSVEHLRGKHFDFEWESKVSNRSNGKSCPFLSNPAKAIWPGFNDLATVHPELAVQWHPTKNGDKKPTDFLSGSGEKVWWIQSYDVPDDYPVEHLRGKHFDFEWEAVIRDRSRGSGCIYLSNPPKGIYQGFNDLATVNPELASQWHSTKNGDLKPTDVTAGTTTKVWWLQSYDVPNDYPVEHLRGKHFDFEWPAQVSNRTNGDDCPFLSKTRPKVWQGFNDLVTVNPELAMEWHPTKNGDLKPSDVTCGSSTKVWWLYSYDVPDDYPVESLCGKHFDFEWPAIVGSRNSGADCPFLKDKQVWKGFNDLATVNPELAAQWNYEKNAGRINGLGEDISTPDKITAGSNETVWWKYSYDVPDDYLVEHLRGKHFDFEWPSKINHRNNGVSCPFLAKSKPSVWPGFNDIETVNPELAAQWHSTKNGDKRPSEFSVGSGENVWWTYPYDDPETGKHYDFEWQTPIYKRDDVRACPFLPPACSKQESKMYMWLMDNDIKFVRELSYKNGTRSGRGDNLSRFDIYLPDYNAVVEIDGSQHFGEIHRVAPMYHSSEEQFDANKKSDNARNEYCKEHGVKLLRLPYFIKSEKQCELVNRFLNTGKVPDSIIDIYDKYDFSTYGDTVRVMNEPDFGSDEFPKMLQLNEAVFSGVNRRRGLKSKCNEVSSDVLGEENTAAIDKYKTKVKTLKNVKKKQLQKKRVAQAETIVIHDGEYMSKQYE